MGKVLLWVLVIIVALFVMRVVASRAAARNAVPPPKSEEKSRSRWGARGSSGSQSDASRDAGDSSSTARRGPGPGNLRPPAGRAPDPTLGASEPMVRCAHCGIHLPRSEALMKNGQTWCSDAHAQLGVRQT